MDRGFLGLEGRGYWIGASGWERGEERPSRFIIPALLSSYCVCYSNGGLWPMVPGTYARTQLAFRSGVPSRQLQGEIHTSMRTVIVIEVDAVDGFPSIWALLTGCSESTWGKGYWRLDKTRSHPQVKADRKVRQDQGGNPHRV
jgi:hypothetical protein